MDKTVPGNQWRFDDLDDVSDPFVDRCVVEIGPRTDIPWRIIAGKLLKRIRGAGKSFATFTKEELDDLAEALYAAEDEAVKNLYRYRPRGYGCDSDTDTNPPWNQVGDTPNANEGRHTLEGGRNG